MKKNVIIFGLTDLAEVLIYHLKNDERYNIVAVCADESYICSGMGKIDYPVVPFTSIEKTFPKDDFSFFLCVGYKKMNDYRKEIYYRIKSLGYSVLTYIHPTSLVQTDRIGEGSLIFENVTIGPYSSVGRGNIFYPCSHIAHHVCIGDFNFFAISCSVAGHVSVESNCFLGNNSTTRDKIVISNRSLVGAGAYLDHSTLEGDVIVPQRSIVLEDRISDNIRL